MKFRKDSSAVPEQAEADLSRELAEACRVKAHEHMTWCGSCTSWASPDDGLSGTTQLCEMGRLLWRDFVSAFLNMPGGIVL